MLEAYEATRDFQLAETTVTTPITETTTHVLAGKKVAVVPILRAGLGMVDGILELIPAAQGGPHRPVPRPRDAASRSSTTASCPRTSPSATSSSSTRCSRPAARPRPRSSSCATKGAQHIDLLVLIAAPEGIEEVVELLRRRARSTRAPIDSHLNDHGYIVPGLGDAGDRLFGTK